MFLNLGEVFLFFAFFLLCPGYVPDPGFLAGSVLAPLPWPGQHGLGRRKWL